MYRKENLDMTRYRGLATDTKPDADFGSTFHEMDTGDIYRFDGSEWQKCGSLAGTDPSIYMSMWGAKGNTKKAWELSALASGHSDTGIFKTVTGNPISVSDALAARIKSLSVDMSPIQEGSGDPSPDNVRPITGRDSVTVERTGVNLFPNPSGARSAVDLKAGVEYCFSANGASSAVAVSGKYADGTTFPTLFLNKVSGNIRYNSRVLEKDVSEIVIYLNNVTLYDCQIEVGSTATAYEPYDGQSVTVQLGTTVYGGTVDVITGKATIAWKKYIGSAFAAASARTGGFYSRMLLGGETYAGGQITPARYACNMAVKEKDLYDKWYYYAAGNLGGTVSYVHMYIPADAIDYHEGDNVTALLNAAYNASDFEFVLPLAEPFDITLTPASLSTLRGDNTVWSDGDSVTMTYKAVAE